MIIFVKAKPGARQEKIERTDGSHFTVSVREPPVKGLANMAIRKVLADYFRLSDSKVQLKSGFSSRTKVFEIFK